MMVINSTNINKMNDHFSSGFVNNKKGALDSQPQVIKLTSCLPMIGVLSGYSGFFHH
jgi:hypothetical protein